LTPPIVAPVATVTKSKVADMIRSAVAEERTSTRAAFDAVEDALVDIGSVTGALERRLNELERRFNELWSERSGDAIVDLPNWRSDVVQH
jgi:hypothetical protein